MPCNYSLKQTGIKLPETLIKAYCLEGIREDGTKEILQVCDNHQRFVRHSVDWCDKEVHLIPISTWGQETFRVFGFELNG